MPKPAIVFVPGAHHSPPMYSPTLSLLSEAGYSVTGIHLPNVTEGTPPVDFGDDVAATRKGILDAIDNEQDVMLVMHSYGGVPGTQATEGLLKSDREARGLKNGIVRLYYLASLVLYEGYSLGQTFENIARAPYVELINDSQVKPYEHLAAETFFNDLPKEDADALVRQLKPHGVGCVQSRLTYAAWKYVPSTYLVTLLDKALPVSLLEEMASRLGDGCTVERIEAGHMATNSRPEEVARSIRRAAGENV